MCDIICYLLLLVVVVYNYVYRFNIFLKFNHPFLYIKICLRYFKQNIKINGLIEILRHLPLCMINSNSFNLIRTSKTNETKIANYTFPLFQNLLIDFLRKMLSDFCFKSDVYP